MDKRDKVKPKLISWIFTTVTLGGIISAIIALFLIPSPTLFQYRLTSALVCFALSSIAVLMFTANVKITGKIGLITIEVGGTAALWLAALLVFNFVYPESMLQRPDLTEKMPIFGKITKEGRSSHEGIMIGIISENCKTFTDSNGNYEIQILPGENSYTGLAYFRDGGVKDIYIGGVNIDPKTKKGTFNYAFGR
jgi:hypothetical protein